MVSVKRSRSTGSSMAERARPRTVIRVQSDAQPSNIDLMEDLENATPFELAWPSANSSSAISLYDFWPPFGSLQNLQDWWAEPWLVTGYQPGPGKNRVVADLVARTAHCVSARRLLAGGLLTYCVPQMTVQVAKAVELRGSVACNHCRANAELIVAIANPKDGRTSLRISVRMRKANLDTRIVVVRGYGSRENRWHRVIYHRLENQSRIRLSRS